jgi:hypothetical protein
VWTTKGEGQDWARRVRGEREEEGWPDVSCRLLAHVTGCKMLDAGKLTLGAVSSGLCVKRGRLMAAVEAAALENATIDIP